MMNTDGAQQQRLTNSDGKDTTPAFSPDGQKIVFASVRDASYIQICIMDLSRTLTRAELLARVQKQIKQTW
jgi:Tol biopolymer transport system component